MFSFRPQKPDISEENEVKKETNCLEDDLYESIFHEEIYNVELPKNFNDVQQSQEKRNWVKAMEDELKVMKDRKVWKLVDPPPQGVKILGNKWVYSVKRDDKNNIKRYKARLVAQGYRQKYGIDYTDIFSPVVNFSIIRFLFIILVSLLRWKHVQLDVKSAYLYGNLKEKIYMQQPDGFKLKGSEDKVCLLEKTIYGLHQSGREWNKELDSILNSIGFETIKWCNFYVDDILLFGIETSVIGKTIQIIKEKLDIEELGKVKYLLGVNFETTDKGIYLHQETYINRLITIFTDLPKTLVNLPFKTGCWLPPKIKEDEIFETELMRKYPYRSIIDLMNYVFRTKHYKIKLSNVNRGILNAYSDANWGRHLTNRHSTSGYILYLDDTLFTWKSRKQKCIALSSMESEFIALTESVKETIWYFNILKEIDVLPNVGKPIQFCDNQSAIYFCKNSVENIKTKHIDIRLQFIRKLVEEEEFTLKFVNSNLNLADFLTKPLSKKKLSRFIEKLFWR
ncbi:hypothetical protein LAZ67_11002199 [Cordylochernes scorpioides]|uniref:Reverse transcriptase Ty1/copia-type domain-containing protein n=1 Tax=Cordylochernes scorpioides TaxID=51811 RepID=A0ABY6KZ20_9ARAC|nr:hypothetical protein LAZ67_11002199 [Cordylochernes scorpioides]